MAHFIHTKIVTILILSSLFIGSMFLSAADVAAKNKKMKWKSQPNSLQVGKTFRYRIMAAPKKSKIRFYSSKPKLAKINAKTGKIYAKKPGTVIVKAKIKEKHRSRKLKTRLKIISKIKSDLPKGSKQAFLKNVHFSAAENINPWNHSLLLYSDRILLQKEVKNTSLQITPSDNTDKTCYNASFRSLSPDGKTICYGLSQKDAEQLCPGNGTKNNTYSITASFFSGKLTTHYQERITSNSISGYVLDRKGSVLPGASVQLSSENPNTILDTIKTDENGFYQFTDITGSNLSITASLTGYDTLCKKNLNPLKHALCQNFILPAARQDRLALSCQILNPSNHPVRNATVILKDTATNAAIRGQVDENAYITFARTNSFNSGEYTFIKYQNQLTSPVYQTGQLPQAKQIYSNPDFKLQRNTTYELQILPSSCPPAIMDYAPLTFHFSFADAVSDQLLFHITVQELPVLHTDSMSINTDRLKAKPSDLLHYSLYSASGNLLFQTILPLSHTNTELTKKLNAAFLESEIRLYDGDYYISLSALDQNHTPLSAGEIQSVYIKDGHLNSPSFHLSPATYTQAFLYAKMPVCEIERSVSFTLYQQFASLWFPINTFSADGFSSVHEDSCKSVLTLSGLMPNNSYFLLPDKPSYAISSNLVSQNTAITATLQAQAVHSGFSFSTKEGSESPTFSNSLENIRPSFQIILDTDNTEMQENSTHETIPNINAYLPDVSWDNSKVIILNQSYYDTAGTYPNTVYSYCQMDGKLLNISLQSMAEIAFSTNAFITNCLKNGTDIRTTQTSYRLTPFFVT